ncbi:hypothetical protein C1645_741135 [Glomus cerebriforme]|uniref:CBM20 domain-containing protein n=1 Tax=Glomus cerebriforme TaxID=658196 RepID=A0A397SJ22_9GLOM|nr:hypothetical protein C1645_741135 [Glomus cerebriforme]
MENKTIKFHIHLPGGIEQIGQPIVLGDGIELGSWKNPIVKLHRPFPKNSTYWQSEPVTIFKTNNIKYKFAIHISTSSPDDEGESIFEGNSPEDNRILDIKRENQFAIWKNNTGSNICLDKVQDYAFVDYIYDSIRVYNLNEKILEYEYLLTFYKDITNQALNIDFIINNIHDKLKEKQVFLCRLLGHYISKQDYGYELPKYFPSESLLDVLDNYEQKSLPWVARIPIQIAITYLVVHNAFQYRFNWLKIFTVAMEIDPGYIFIYHLSTLKYPNDDLLEKFIKEIEVISPFMKNIEIEIYINIAKWLIEICHNNDALFKLWSDILLHNDVIDKTISKTFLDQIQNNISDDDAVALENRFKMIPKDFQDNVSEAFRNQALRLFKNILIKWEDPEVSSIKEFLQDDNLNWKREDIIQLLELISRSNNLELLNLFPEILDEWFHKGFSDTKERRIPRISENWFKDLLYNLEKNDMDENKFVFLIFQKLENMYPLIGYRKNLWKKLATIAINRVKSCSETQIINATKFIVELKEREVKELFSNIILKEVMSKINRPINDRFINKIFTMCNCKGEILMVPNAMCEDILCYIMFTLQNQMFMSSTSEEYLSIIESSKFWIIILNATGYVENLRANSYFRRIQISTAELNKLLFEKTINMKLLRQILDFSDEQLFRYFYEAIGENNFFGDVIISQDKIATIRQLYNDYELQLNQLFEFYSRFCSDPKVTDINHYLHDIRQRMEHSDKVRLKQVLTTDYWSLHEKSLNSARSCHELSETLIFRNIFKSNLQMDAAATTVEYIAQKLVPTVIEKYYDTCETFKG